jgi:hypothetical protein
VVEVDERILERAFLRKPGLVWRRGALFIDLNQKKITDGKWRKGRSMVGSIFETNDRSLKDSLDQNFHQLWEGYVI